VSDTMKVLKKYKKREEEEEERQEEEEEEEVSMVISLSGLCRRPALLSVVGGCVLFMLTSELWS